MFQWFTYQQCTISDLELSLVIRVIRQRMRSEESGITIRVLEPEARIRSKLLNY